MPAEAPTLIAIDRELAQLAQSPIAVLRARWRGEFHSDPPPGFGPDLLRRSLAYKLQEDGYGKLPAATQRELARLVAQIVKNPSARLALPHFLWVGGFRAGINLRAISSSRLSGAESREK